MMNYDFSPAGFKTAIVIVGVLLFYYTYFYLAHSRAVERMVKRKLPGDASVAALSFFRKMAGFFILGVVPGMLYFGLMDAPGEKFGLTFNHLASSILLISGLVLLTAIVLYFHHRRDSVRSLQQDTPTEWSGSLFMLDVLGWTFYLVAYEFLFRGILLFESFEVLGFWPAVAVNVSLYSAIHMVNGKDQALGALVFGTVACYFALTRGTLLIPIFMHLSLSILSDFYSFRSSYSVSVSHKQQSNRGGK